MSKRKEYALSFDRSWWTSSEVAEHAHRFHSLGEAIRYRDNLLFWSPRRAGKGLHVIEYPANKVVA